MNINDLTIESLEKENYFATQELVDVVNAAIFLDKPLLIEGPAGTGKTFLAVAVALTMLLEKKIELSIFVNALKIGLLIKYFSSKRFSFFSLLCIDKSCFL